MNLVKAVSPLRGGKLHCLSVIYPISGHETTKISPSANFSSDVVIKVLFEKAELNFSKLIKKTHHFRKS